jgi:ATP-dependent Clp protease ATP-binding subunit ClpX
MGFTADVRTKDETNLGELLSQARPQDLLQYGLIPEFIGRLPAVVTLHELDQQSLIDILTKPKNALIKQYSRLFEIENVKLTFSDAALAAVAKEAMERASGARGLRAILEGAMLDIMYELPGQTNVKEVVISEEVITNGERPILVYENQEESPNDQETA